MDFTAKLIQIMPPITGEGKNGQWKRQEYIFETESQYPRKICVSVWGDRGISDPNIMQVGNVLTVSFDLESREFNGRWYTDVRAWRISLPLAAPAGGGYAQTPAGYASPGQSPSYAPAAPQTYAPASATAAASASMAPEFPTSNLGAPADGDDLPF